MSNNQSNTGSGIGFTSLLLIAFIVLKLCNVIDWSWWWVLSPFWIPVALVLPLLGYQYYKHRQETKIFRDLKKIMDKTGKNEMAAKKQYEEENNIQLPKSKWQQRMEEMQRAKSN